MSVTPVPITLRGLPLPAKLVLSCFLLAVGLGYVSAMVQLHLQHSDRDGNPLPTVDNVIERFSGLKKPKPGAAAQSKIELLVLGDPAGDLTKENMAPAFFAKSKGYAKECEERGKEAVDREREGDRKALLAWLRAGPDAQKQSYESDAFPMTDELKSGVVTTPAFADVDNASIRIKSLIDARCGNCHKEGDQDPVLVSFEQLRPLVTPPREELLPGGWVRSAKQMSIEGLTQSTHAHLLSFAMLFTLTGLTFAFTSYPVALRCVLGPLVLVAQVADVGCWWLARLPEVGPYFAMTIIATGATVGAGLLAQIGLSLLNMYGWLGRVVVLAVMIAGVAGMGVLFQRAINPALQAEKAAAEAAAKPAPVPAAKPAEKAKPKAEEKPEKADAPPAAPEPPKAMPAGPAASHAVSQLERLVAGPTKTGGGVLWNGSEKGTMAPAFFDRSEGWKEELKERGPNLFAEREGERQAVLAWIRLPDADRKKAYEADLLPLPQPLAGKPLTADYLSADKKAAKVRTILADRCVRCHQKGGDQEDYPLETYEHLLKYLGPEKK